MYVHSVSFVRHQIIKCNAALISPEMQSDAIVHNMFSDPKKEITHKSGRFPKSQIRLTLTWVDKNQQNQNGENWPTESRRRRTKQPSHECHFSRATCKQKPNLPHFSCRPFPKELIYPRPDQLRSSTRNNNFYETNVKGLSGRVFVSRPGSNWWVIRHFSGLFLHSEREKTVSLRPLATNKSCLSSFSLPEPKWKDRIFKRSLLISFCYANHTTSSHNGYSDISYTWQ